MNSILPVLTRALKESREKVLKIVQYAFDFMAIFALPVLVGGFLLSKPLIAAISSDDFLSTSSSAGSDVALRIVLFAMVFTFFHAVFGFTLVALGKQVKLLWINLAATVFNITLNVLLIPRFSFVAVASIAVFSEVFIFVCVFWCVRNALKFSLSLKMTRKSLLSAAVMGMAIYYFQPLLQSAMGLKSLFISVPLGAAMYLAGLYLTKAISPELLALIKKRDMDEAAADPF